MLKCKNFINYIYVEHVLYTKSNFSNIATVQISDLSPAKLA